MPIPRRVQQADLNWKGERSPEDKFARAPSGVKSSLPDGAATRQAVWRTGLAALLLVCVVPETFAQRPFPVNDPFYQSETARRSFYDGIAVTGELSYRAATVAPGHELPTATAPLGFSFRLHYQLAPRLDLNAFWDATGTASGRTVMLSWVGLKYFWTVDDFDYAFRLAVDPSTDGRVGFPQMDVAFISTKALSPVLSSDFALGVRRVRKGFRQFAPPEDAGIPLDGPLVVARSVSPRFVDTRALGMELHFMLNYSLIFDPARSNLFLSFVGQGGEYTLFEGLVNAPARQSLPGEDLTAAEQGDRIGSVDYRSGALWVRSGIEFNRPSYQVMPFMGFPVKQWAPEETDRVSMQFGVRVMLR